MRFDMGFKTYDGSDDWHESWIRICYIHWKRSCSKRSEGGNTFGFYWAIFRYFFYVEAPIVFGRPIRIDVIVFMFGIFTI